MSHPPGSWWGCPCSHKTGTFHTLQGARYPHVFRLQLGFFCQVQNVFGSTRSPAQPAKMPQPSPGRASSIDESVVSSPRVFRNLAAALSTKAPSTTPAGLVGNQQSWPESCSEPTGEDSDCAPQPDINWWCKVYCFYTTVQLSKSHISLCELKKIHYRERKL